MKKYILLVICCLTSLSSSLNAQIDSAEYIQFKVFLPYLMKAIQNNSKTQAERKELLQKAAYIPVWKIDNFSQKDIDDFLNTLESNSKVTAIPQSDGYSNLNIVCNLQNFESEPKLKQGFRNLLIELSDFNIYNQASENIYIDSKSNSIQPKVKAKQEVKLQGAQVNVLIPIREKYSSIRGDVVLAISEKQDYSYEIVSVNEIGRKFKLAGTEIECLSIEGYRATFKLSEKINGLEYTSINRSGRKHIQSVASYIPTIVYEKSLEENLTKEDIESFVTNYSYEDYIDENQSYILTYEASGSIAEIHLFLSKLKKERGSRKINISF